MVQPFKANNARATVLLSTQVLNWRPRPLLHLLHCW